MDTISVIRGLYQAHLSELGKDIEARQGLTGQFVQIMDEYVRLQIPNAIFDGEIPKLLFDESDNEWHNVDVSNANVFDYNGGPFAYRVIERPGETTCKVCGFIHGKTLPYRLRKPGLTAPPFHPNCKGWIEVIDRRGNVLFIVGRQPDAVRDLIGKTVDAFNPDSVLNGIQFLIDVMGLIPAAGDVADMINAGISLLRGNMLDAGLSAASAIPFAGWTSTGGKWLKNILKHGDEITDVAKYADDIIDGVAKYGDELAEGAGKVIKEAGEEAAEGVGKRVDDVVEGAVETVELTRAQSRNVIL